LASRNPEDLLDIFTLLTWAEMALSEAEVPPSPALQGAIERIAPILRSLRHADGGLARFHGGGRGLEGRLDAALAASGIKAAAPGGMAMGYTRLNAGRTTIITDTAPPPLGA
ncbi:MAG TPA: heparinase, partial [Roseovarius nubinhibens]|nr:heparinase [Roseovarius nubinhibens]